MATPTSTLEKLLTLDDDVSDMYSLYIYYVNCDLIKPGDKPPPFGIVFPCGQYKSKEKAQAARDKLAAVTGAHCVVLCKNYLPFPLNANPSENTITYLHDENKGVEEITHSIVEARNKKKQIRERIAKEVEEREDKESMSYLINQIYQMSFSMGTIERIKHELKKAEEAHLKALSSVKDYFVKHPEAREGWMAETQSRLQERGEIDLYNSMVKRMNEKGLLTERLASVSDSFDLSQSGHIMEGC